MLNKIKYNIDIIFKKERNQAIDSIVYMRKTKKTILSIFAIAIASFSLASCGDDAATTTKEISNTTETTKVSPTTTETTTETVVTPTTTETTTGLPTTTTETHDYTISYIWDLDSEKCKALAECKSCGDDISEEVKASKVITKEATCIQDGIITYTATFNNSLFEMQTKEVNVGKGNHNLINYYGYAPTFFNEGRIEHNKCSLCNKCFDLDGNEIDNTTIPVLSKEISLSINDTISALTLVKEEASLIVWELEVSKVEEYDLVKLLLKDGTEYAYFNGNGIDENKKVTVSKDDVKFIVSATPNGVNVGLDYETVEKGIYVEVTNDNGTVLYPMSEISYNFGTETKSYVYGYISLLVNDKVLIKDTINDKTYGYDDIIESEAWRSHYFTLGDDGEIIIKTTDRIGFEFDRNGDKKLAMSFVHEPVDATSVSLVVKGEEDTLPLTKNTVAEDSNEYGNALLMLNHETTVNATDMQEHIQANGYTQYSIELPITDPVSILLKDNLDNTYGYSVFENIYSETSFTYSADDGYIHLETPGTYVIMFTPVSGTISIYFIENSTKVDAYYMTNKTSFTGLAKSGNLVTLENIDFDKNDYIVFMDASYNMLTVTLGETSDFVASSQLVKCQKAGKYNLSLNLDTLVLQVEVVEYVDISSISLVGGMAMNLDKYCAKTCAENASDTTEVVAKDMVITAENQKVAIYDAYTDGVTDISVDADSASMISLLVSGSYFLVFAEAGTYDIYVTEETHVVRVVKTA